MMEAVRTSETSVDNHFTRQYNQEDSSEYQFIPSASIQSRDCLDIFCITIGYTDEVL
jgi:hypothetical protein